MLLPFENLLAPLFPGPDRRKAATFNYINDLIEGDFEVRQRFAWGNLCDACSRSSFLADKLNKGGIALALVPPPELQRSQVLDVVAVIDRNSLRLHPFIVRIVLAPHFSFSLHRLRHH